jgi:NAD-dependent dihydropyrimidine dehydrogenase PreA subunit
MNQRFVFSLLAASLVSSNLASAQLPNEELVCRADTPQMDKYGYLRSLMLDLKGTAPTLEDYARLDSVDDVTPEMIDEMLSSEAFVGRVVRLHRSFLWNNVDNVSLLNFRTSMRRTSGLYWRTRPAITYRGDGVPCRDVPATFDAQGNIEVETDANGVRREGWVMVRPYWAPTTEIKVCAFDAQQRAYSASGTDCKTNGGFNDTGCGCGTNLQLCRYGSAVGINRAMAGDVDRRIADVIRRDRPYEEIFTSKKAYVNGPMVHYLKHQTGVPAGVRLTPSPYKIDRLPDLNWSDDASNWQQITLNAEHAGILTSPAYLLRFQTNRARANRFYDAFLCQPFSAPPGGLEAPDPSIEPHPDLQQRDGCKYCHTILEPASSHWGRWAERGAGHLDTATYPAYREDCFECGSAGRLCSAECRSYYITSTFSSLETPYIGSLRAFGFLKPEHERHVDQGPKLLVSTSIVDDRFPNCSARRAMQGFFGRALSVEEEQELKSVSRAFVASNYSYRALVKAIVTSPVYRRVR